MAPTGPPHSRLKLARRVSRDSREREHIQKTPLLNVSEDLSVQRQRPQVTSLELVGRRLPGQH